MKARFQVKAKRWLIVGMLLLMSISPVRYVQAAGLSGTEISWLTFMREEEKLARDVYLYLLGIWGLRIFDNISGAEQTHMAAVKTLLDRYGVPDPASGNGEGVFTGSSGLQPVYDELIDQGSKSLVDALRVGVFIEQKDIDDLKAAIASTTHKDIKTVYSNLLQGSLNHLNAFCSNLAKRGQPCEPIVLP